MTENAHARDPAVPKSDLGPTPFGFFVYRMTWVLGWMLVFIGFTYPPLGVFLSALTDEHEYDPLRLLVRPDYTLQVVGILLVLALLTFLIQRVLTRIPLKLRRLKTLHASQDGALIVEFALAFPFILVLVFILFQWIELLIADSLLHYAAFAACRTAVTWGHMPDAGAQGGQRFQLDQAKLERMRLTAVAALAGARLLEAREHRDTSTQTDGTKVAAQAVQLELLTDAATQEDGPNPGGNPSDPAGSYRTVAVNVSWGFFPRWPLAQVFFNARAMIQGRGRIQMTRGYRMQHEGYFRSESLREIDEYVTREAVAQCALYEQTLIYDHTPSEETKGTRSALGQNCPRSPADAPRQTQCPVQ